MTSASGPLLGTIRDQVYRIIKDDICNGRFAPGQRLQETELAQRLNVSRSPIREALRLLAGDGLVTELPNKGVFVKEFTRRDIEEIFELRVMMECYAILHAEPDKVVERRDELLEYIGELTGQNARDDLQQYIDTDAQLHNCFIELCDNSLLIDSYRRVHAMIQQFRIFSLMTRKRFDDSVCEHRNTVHCILTGSLTEAEQINREHLQLAKQNIISYMMEHSKLSE